MAKSFEEFDINTDHSPSWSDLMENFGDTPPPMPERTGFAGIGDDIKSGGAKAWPAVKSSAGFLKDLLIEQMTPRWDKGTEDFVDRDRFGIDQADPTENYRIAGAGLAKGGNILGNIAPNIRDYGARKFPADEYPHAGFEEAPSFRIPGMPDESYDYLGAMGAPGTDDQSKGQEFLYELMKRLPLGAASGGNPYILEAGRAIGENENPIPAMATVGAFEGATKALPTVRKGARSVKGTLEGVSKKAGQLKEKALDPIRKAKKNYIEREALEKEILEDTTASTEIKERKLATERTIEEAFDEYSMIDKDAAKTNLAEEVKRYYEDSYEQGSTKYNDFRNSSYGQKRIFEPIQAEFFDKQYSFPEGAISETTRSMIDNTIGKYSETMRRDPLTGQPRFDVKKQKGTGTVQSYVDLYRQLRDEAGHIRQELKNPNAKISYGEKQNMTRAANSLDRLKFDVEQKINNSLPDKGIKQFKDAQDYWKNNVTPFKEKSFLRNALKENPEINTQAFLEQFGKKGVADLKEAMLKNESLKDAIIKHDMAFRETATPRQLQKLLREDIANHLPPELRSRANELMSGWKNDAAMLEDLKIQLAKKKIASSEANQRINDIKELIKGGAKGAAYSLALKWVIGN